MKFKDSSGTEFTINCSSMRVIRAEKRSGEGLLASMLAGAEAETEAEQVSAIFGSTERLCAVLYECSVPLKQQDELPFEDFCEGIEYAALFELAPVLIEALFASFAMPGGSQLPPDDPDEGGADAKKDPGT